MFRLQHHARKEMRERGLIDELDSTSINTVFFKKALAMDADRVKELCKRAKAMTRHMVDAPKQRVAQPA